MPSLLLRYVELGGCPRAGGEGPASAHSKDIRFFDIAKDSIRIGRR
jgi:hypothetical protein